MKNFSTYRWLILLLVVPVMFSCKKKDTTPEMIVSFTYSVDAVNFKKVTFTNASQNYSSLSWNFGDNTTSTEVSPVHNFPDVGTYTVTLTGTASDGTKEAYTKTITIADPNTLLTMLAGDSSKVWKLIRVTSSGRYPIECGPEDHSSIWWAMGRDNNELANRPCMLNDEWVLSRTFGLKFDPKGDYWAEGGIFEPANICANTADPMVGPAGENLSAWGGGNFSFELIPGTPPQIKAVGMGAYLGFFKLGNGSETKVPLDHVTYNIVKIVDDHVDTLIIEGVYRWDPLQPGGYWRFVLMHYDDPSEEPPMPGNKPTAGFSFSQAGNTVTFTNTTTEGNTYSWDFGDGTNSTDMNPVHTYASQGIFNVTLTATNSNGSSSASAVVFVGVDLSTLTASQLAGGAWKVRAEEKSVFVGSGLGKSDWWSVPKNFLTGGGAGTDDWSCMPDDQFIFGAGGSFSYATNGSARNDGFFGSPNGCWTDAQINGGPGAPFGTCSTHTWAFTAGTASTRPIITLTNGAGFAAFIGFYKGYYGGENSDGTKPANGGLSTNTYEVMGYANTGSKEYLFVSVDISAAHNGSSAWSMILER